MFNILPIPRMAAPVGGKDARVKLAPKYNAEGLDGGGCAALSAFSGYAEKAFGVRFESVEETVEGTLILSFDNSLPDGGYALIVSPEGGITLAAKDSEALCHGFASLLMAAEKEGGELYLPVMHIFDEPKGSYRGLMVDLARRFHPLPWLYRAVDLCWLYKLNRLQLHFTDDQSYTLPSSALPLLPTEGRNYTVDELKALWKYAADRGVTIVPEVDMPGHCTQFNRIYPEIFGDKGIICAEEKAFAALDSIIDEVIEIFPDAPYIHLGGDEAAISRWDDCEGCRAYRESEGLPDVHALYAHFLQRVTDMVLAKGRTPIIWEGFSKEYNHLISKDVLVIAWESYYQLAPDLLASGFTIINCSWKPLYVVAPRTHWTPAEILNWNIFTWQHWWEKSIASKQEIHVPKDSAVLGGQVCAWGDSLGSYPTDDEACSAEFALLRERIPALAEKTWNIFSELDADSLAARYAHTNALLERILS